ncbi:MAG: response regulator transcription factor [Treponema sp.]|uniref:response regulator transcription factor n=1 Tax=Treponema sp. TaxID=166 RepID=UPI002A912816|nr:response regulator transcription factor [Treponema sp.]MDY6398036.1 response regulator transcription factor [Treponema sp.]
MISDKKFFVVEDHTLTNLGIRELLESKDGFFCSGFAFGKTETIEKLSELSDSGSLPDILILDLFLGKESGLELLREIRVKFPSIKILVYSMYAKPGILSLALEAGAHGFVEKSAPETILLSAVNDILSGQTFVQQNLVSPLITYKTMLDGLTKQEQKILKKLLERKTKAQIAEELNIVPRSVDNYLSRIFEKTGTKGHKELIEKFAE